MHYMNGREAKVGDMVIGRTYNRKEAVSGTVLSITPGVDACSVLLGMLKVTLVDEDSGKIEYGQDTLVKIQGTASHGNQGPLAATSYSYDYTECNMLLHVEDALK